MWNNEDGLKEKITQNGETQKFIQKTISGGYLFDGEKPKEAYQRVSTTVARRLGKPEMAANVF